MDMKRKHESYPIVHGPNIELENPQKIGDVQTTISGKIKARKKTNPPDLENTNENELEIIKSTREDPLSEEEIVDDQSISNRRESIVLDGPTFPSTGLNPISPNSIEPSQKIMFRESTTSSPLLDGSHGSSMSFPPKRARNRNPGNLILDLSQMSPVPSPKHTKSDYSNICSQVTDFMFVGGSVVAAQREVLQSHGITHVINCAASITPNYFPQEFDYFHLRLRDHATQDIHQHFYNIFQFIDEARERHGKVFIHCVKGISRSPTMAVAYLMAREQLGLYGALDLVRASRPVIDPNAGFIFQLNEWDTLRQHSRKQVTLFRIDIAPTDSDICTSRYPLIIGPISPDKLIKSRGLTQEVPPIDDEHASACFVICSLEAKYCSLWCGRDVCDELVETGKHAMRLLQTYEAFPDTFDVVWSGQEPNMFWNVLKPENDPNTM